MTWRFLAPLAAMLCLAGTVSLVLARSSGGQAFRSPSTGAAGRHATQRQNPARRRSPRFISPAALAVTSSGTVIVADQGAKRVVALSPTGKVLARWRHAGGHPAAFTQMYGLALDSAGDVFVSDAADRVIDKLGPTGAPLAQWNTSKDGASSFPTGLAVGGHGDVYVADHAVGGVLHLSHLGALLETIGVGQLGDPYGVASGPDDNLYVADFGASQVLEFSPQGGLIATLGAGRLASPEGIAVDGQDHIYVSERSGRIVTLDRSGAVRATWRRAGKHALNDPSGLALDGAGNLYVAEYMGKRVDKLSPHGRLLAQWR